jgi:energy-coupling factor transporter ATP-binding protein EcfA2
MAPGAHFRIKQWDCDSLRDGRIILLVGRRGSGKSTMMENIMYALRDRLDVGVAMTPTEESMDAFRAHIPETFVYPAYDVAQVQRLLSAQRVRLAERRALRHVYVFLDDCMYDKAILKSVVMRDLFMNGRHLRITLCMAMQYLMDMGPDLRTQCDYVICMAEKIQSNRHKLWKYFFGVFERYEHFGRVLDATTADYGALILDNTVQSSAATDCVFWYRATLSLPPFFIGSRTFRRLAMHHTKSADELRHEARLRLTGATSKAPPPKIIVQVEDADGNVVD